MELAWSGTETARWCRYDVPTEAFSFAIFRQAFAAIQASVVHLQVCFLSVRFELLQKQLAAGNPRQASSA